MGGEGDVVLCEGKVRSEGVRGRFIAKEGPEM